MKKTKLIITESQYNRLILEQSYSLDEDDVLILKLEPKKDSEGEDLPSEIIFGVIDAIGDYIIMINCNEEGYQEFKNDIFTTNLNTDYDKSKGQLLVYRLNKKNIKTIEEYKEELKLKGKKYTFGKTRKIDDIEIQKNKARSLGCNLFKFVKSEPDEKFKNLSTGWMEITFGDGSKMNINVFEKRGTKLLFDFELDDNDEIIKMKGDAENFVSKLRNEDFKYLSYGVIDIKDLSKLNENENNPIIDLIYQKGDKELKIQKELNGVKSIDILKDAPKTSEKNDKKDDADEKDADKKDADEYSVKDYEEYLKNNPVLLKAILNRPGLFSSFFGAIETGISPSDDIINSFLKYTKKNAKKMDYIKFIGGSDIIFNMGKIKDIRGLVSKTKISDPSIYIYTNGNKEKPTESNYKYKYKLIRDYNKDGRNDEYSVVLVEKDGKRPNEKEEVRIKVTDYGSKKDDSKK